MQTENNRSDVRFEYREGLAQTEKGLKVIHTVYDLWYEKIMLILNSKYSCRQYIKKNQEII